MTLPASGAISFEDLKNEFGDGTGSVSFERYYKGTEGEVPPSYGAGNNPNVPTSGSGTSISLNNFYSAQNIWQTTITSTGSRSEKLLAVYGYETGVLPLGQIGGNGDFLYNLTGKLTRASNSQSGLTRTINITVSANTSIDANAWTTVTFFNATSTVRIAKTSMSYTASAPRFNFGQSTSVSSGAGEPEPFGPEGSKMTILFENNG